MNVSCPQVIASILLSFCGYSFCVAQSSGPEFLECSPTDSLSVQDEGVRLLYNNQLYFGEDNPDANSCSVHITQRKRVRAACGTEVQYEVQLLLFDTSAPLILTPLTTITIDSTGEAELSYNSELSPTEEIWFNGIPYTSGCHQFHRVKWIVKDSCGSETICEQRIDVYDGHKPEIRISAHIFHYYFDYSAYIYVYGEDLVGAKDDCTIWEEFQISFDSLSYQPIKEFYFCDAPGFSILLPYNIWIADHGRDSNCDGEIAWDERSVEKKQVVLVLLDNTQVIDCVEEFEIAGNVRTEYGAGIKDVFVTPSSPGQIYPTYVTAENGNYTYLIGGINGEATIRPERNDFHKNGVSTLDLVKIQKHLLGIETLESPLLLIAADANNSQNVSAIDMIELRKLILGTYTEFPSNTSWKFVRANYVFPDPDNPWLDQNIGSITFTDVTNPGNLDFIGIKIGDVNHTAQPNLSEVLPRNTFTPIKLLTDQQSYKTGDIINVPIRISSHQTLSGFQFTMTSSGMEVINIRPGMIAVSEEHYALFGDKFTMSWFDENSIDVSVDDVLFTVQLRAISNSSLKQTLSINSDITEAELYLADEETFLPVLTFQNEKAENGLKIISCSPNPWKDETSVSFYLPESDNVVFNLFDVAGRKVFSQTQFLKDGYHEHHLNTSCFADRGMMFFEISTSNDKAVRKMIVLE